MHRKPVLGLVLAAATLATAAPVFAQRHDSDQRQEHRGGPPQRQADRGHGQWEREVRDRDVRGPVAYRASGPEWHRGGHIPPAYRERAYVVNDWRAHRLAPPPRGYEWVQVGPDYVLVTVRTGVIAQIIVG